MRNGKRLAPVVAAVAGGVLAACSGGSSGPGAVDGAAGPADAGADVALACPPAPLDEWAAPAYRHAQPQQPLACSALLINDFYQSCLGPASSNDACQQSWGAGADTAHSTCEACLVTSGTSTLLGPLVSYGGPGDAGTGGTVSVNVAGCVELLDPTQVACATAVQQADACEHAACDAVCPVTDATSFAEWQRCAAAAATGGCTTYVQASACMNGEDAGPAAACVTGQTFADQFLAIATVFCGSTGD